MSLKCGIVGLPNVGKSTLFNALTKAGVAAENYPFCTIEPNVGVVGVPDPQWGERPFALLVLRDGQALDAKGLKEHLKPFVEEGHINKWAIPSQIAIVTDIPKTSVGKLDKKRIRLDIAQWQAAGSAFLSTL